MSNTQLEKLKDEFYQLRYDDEIFENLYDENEFDEWLKDYNIINSNERIT